jgi:Flp pilus assembly protein TadB
MLFVLLRFTAFDDPFGILEKRQQDRQHNGQKKKAKGQTTQWPKEKRQKDRQHNGQKKKDKRTDNTMAKRKKTKGQTTQWSVLLSLFLLAIVLSVLLSFFFWPLYCLSFCLFSFCHCVVCPFVFFLLQYNGQKKKDKRTNNDLQNIT